MQTSTEKSESRIKQFGEVFTPSRLVNQMLSKLPKTVWKRNQTFCDPACGDGNFLVHVLYRKLVRGHNPLEALQCIYGVDIMRDSIRECRLRLLKIIQVIAGETITEDHVKAVFDNIKWLCTKRYPQGSLDYDFAFKKNGTNQKTLDKWMKSIQDGILNEVELPVDEEIGNKQHRDIFGEN